MRVAVITEHRFWRTWGGGAATAGAFPYSFWKRYLAVFDSVRIVARGVEGELPSAGGQRSDGPGVSLFALPDYHGSEQFLLHARRIRSLVLDAFADSDAVILRLPSAIAGLVSSRLRRTGRPFAVEVVGDPWDALGPGAHLHPLRPLFRQILTRSQRRLCAASTASLYVTRQALQLYYPPAVGSFTVGCSDVELPRSAFVAAPRSFQPKLAEPRLVMVGSLGHLYKAPDVLLDAVAECVRNAVGLRATIVGDGQHRGALEERARVLGIGDRVTFRGHLPFGEPVRRELDRADLFVLPSRQEGLPRAMLEAMARGLPAIGSTVGGIPELLGAEDLVPPDDPTALARKITKVVRDPARMERMSAANLATAREYEETLLAKQRNRFWAQLREETEKHFRPSGRLAVAASGDV